MMDSNSQQLVPGSGVRIGCGRVMLTIRAGSGADLALADLGGESPHGGERIRLSGSGTWWVELHEGSSGTLAVQTRDGRLFPDGSRLEVTIHTGTTELRARPFPDVSGLRATELIAWHPAPVGPHGARVELQVLDVSAAVRAGSGPTGGPDRLPVEPLGEPAMSARNVARDLAGGPSVSPALQRQVCLVLDASTSMQSVAAGPQLADAVALALGAADVISASAPELWTASGPQVHRLPPPGQGVTDWLPGVYRPTAFGCSVEALRQTLPRGGSARVVMVLTDDVPADIGALNSDGADPGEDRWEVLVLGGGAPSRRAAGLPHGVRVIPVDGIRGPDGRLQTDGIRRVVAGMLGGLS